MASSAKRSKKDRDDSVPHSSSSSSSSPPYSDLSKELRDALFLALACLSSSPPDSQPQNCTVRLEVGMVVEAMQQRSNSSSSSASTSTSTSSSSSSSSLLSAEVDSLARHLVPNPNANRQECTVVKEAMAGVEFRKGVDEIYLNRHLRNVLTLKEGFSVRQEECRRVYTHGANKSKRWCVDYPEASSVDGGKVTRIRA